jgi:hypothetical protein|nr:MAG TPA: Protein of unknown function (DUF3078) [Caudoviricetes sp.]
MKKLFIAFSLLALTVGQGAAQTDAAPTETPSWKISGVSGLNLSQTSLTNWAAGGENSVAWNLYLNASANYKKDSWSWDNALITDFGKTFTTSNKWLKSIDKLNFSTKIGRSLSKHWSVSALGDFLTQFARGYAAENNPNIAGNKDKYISTLLAPGYLTLAIGADYKPNDDFSLLLSPVTGKMTFVLDSRLSDAGAFGVKPGKKALAEIGALAVANYKRKLAENINLVTKLTLFTPYNESFGNIDINWDMMIAFKINKFLTTTLTTNLVYDDDIKTVDLQGNKHGAKVQFREVLGLGLAYSF